MLTSIRAAMSVGSLAFCLVLGSCALVPGQAASKPGRTDAVPFLVGMDFTRTENGLRITGTIKLSERSYRVFLSSESVSTTAFADGNSIVVTLPVGFDGSRRYPVLYLLNGSGSDGDAMQWFERGDVESVLGDGQVIAVMPDGGNTGWYSNWKAPTTGVRNWQTLHLDELVPWVDGHLPTIASRQARAIGGVSMGGYGAIHYAAARPELFAETFSISGILDFGKQSTRKLIDQQVVAGGAGSGAVFGLPGGAEENPWLDSDPMEGAGKLRNTTVYLAAGSGTAANPVDASDPQQLEFLVRESTEDFSRELARIGIRNELQVLDESTQGCDGGHNWGCWIPEARRIVPQIVSGLSARTNSPS